LVWGTGQKKKKPGRKNGAPRAAKAVGCFFWGGGVLLRVFCFANVCFSVCWFFPPPLPQKHWFLGPMFPRWEQKWVYGWGEASENTIPVKEIRIQPQVTRGVGGGVPTPPPTPRKAGHPQKKPKPTKKRAPHKKKKGPPHLKNKQGEVSRLKAQLLLWLVKHNQPTRDGALGCALITPPISLPYPTLYYSP